MKRTSSPSPGSTTPASVTIALMRRAGVTSKAGLKPGCPTAPWPSAPGHHFGVVLGARSRCRGPLPSRRRPWTSVRPPRRGSPRPRRPGPHQVCRSCWRRRRWRRSGPLPPRQRQRVRHDGAGRGGVDLDDVVDAEAGDATRRGARPAAGAASRWRRPVRAFPLVKIPHHAECGSPASGGEGPCVAVGEDAHRLVGSAPTAFTIQSAP